MGIEPLFLHQLLLDTSLLVGHAKRRRLPTWDLDEGYLVHSVLGEAFGELRPQPYAITGSGGRYLTVLGYSAVDSVTLRQQADLYANPSIHQIFPWDRIPSSKPMPTDWRPGQRLGFELRVCPVVRVGNTHPHFRPGAEVDAFLAEASKQGEDGGLDRQAVYRSWLDTQLETHGGARVERAEQSRFELGKHTRRTQGKERKARHQTRPDATFHGVLEVTDSLTFHTLLARGVGRHRAFGFGMILLRRP